MCWIVLGWAQDNVIWIYLCADFGKAERECSMARYPSFSGKEELMCAMMRTVSLKLCEDYITFCANLNATAEQT
jgi:hypothetical protein